MTTQSRLLVNGSLLIAGTCVGGGILALPVLTGLAGFLPSTVLFFICWLFMSSTGLLFLEVSQWMPKDSNIISMAEKTLGRPGKAFAWILYLFLFYCLTVAYIVGCGNILVELTQFTIPDWLGPLIFVAALCPLLLIPTSQAGRLNAWLVVCLVISYFAFIFIGYSYVDVTLWRHTNWSYTFLALPVAFTAFAYQGTIPTLVHYLNHDYRQARKAILIGSFIPLVAYIAWEGLILGIVPVESLLEAMKRGDNAVYPLHAVIQNRLIYPLGQTFAFFALVTSFLGVTLGLRDFLADGLSIKQDVSGKAKCAALVFIVPLIIAIFHPHIFLVALGYAGGFGCALLLGLLPIIMVWKGRYGLNLTGNMQLRGGKVTLSLLAIFVTIELIHEVVGLFR